MAGDLLRKLTHEKEEEIDELSLGLSSNGRFGVDPKRPKTLIRSSSISETPVPNLNMPLVRTCSLPMETEEEWRKRKNLQSLRRMEARRKRLQKLKGNSGSGSSKRVLSAHLESSTGSQGSGSSGLSEFETPSIQGSNEVNEAVSPASVQSVAAQKPPLPSSGAAKVLPPVKPAVNATPTTEIRADEATYNMPCVSARGDGPNGKMIQGFLYKYGQGEDVCIVCICHGTFLTALDFVKHAGRTDLSNPLKHIVVSRALL